jgi:hypothetical protein
MTTPAETPADQDANPVHPASTIVLVRDVPGGSGIEILMQRKLFKNTGSDIYAFPGASVTPADGDGRLATHVDLDDATASARAGVAGGGLAFWVTAVRKAFEETGYLLATRNGRPVRIDDAATVAHFDALRGELAARATTIADVCVAEQLTLTAAAIHVMRRQVTPPGTLRRTDARYFVARAPEAQTKVDDESVLWIAPRAAIDGLLSGELSIMPPTLAVLDFFVHHATAADVLAAAAGLGVVQPSPMHVLHDEAGDVRGMDVEGTRYEFRLPG